MISLHKFFLVLAASSIAFLGTARAQVITVETVSTWTGSFNAFGAVGDASSVRAETFHYIKGISSVTFRFFTANATSLRPGLLSAKFGEWDSATRSIIGTPIDFGILSIPAPNSWANSTYNPVTDLNSKYFDQTISFGSLYATDPFKTYAIVLKNTVAQNISIALGLNDLDVLSFGQSFDGLSIANKDYTFSQLIVEVPEASTTAAFAGCGLVGVLVALRRRQKQKLSGCLSVTHE